MDPDTYLLNILRDEEERVGWEWRYETLMGWSEKWSSSTFARLPKLGDSIRLSVLWP